MLENFLLLAQNYISFFVSTVVGVCWLVVLKRRAKKKERLVLLAHVQAVEFFFLVVVARNTPCTSASALTYALIYILSPLRLAAAINMFVAVIGLDFLFLRLFLLLIPERSSTRFCTNVHFFSLFPGHFCSLLDQHAVPVREGVKRDIDGHPAPKG